MQYARSFALALTLAFLILPAAPLGGIVPIPTVGGTAEAYLDLTCDSGYTAAYVDCDDDDDGGGFFHDPCMFDVKLFTWDTCQMCVTFSAASWGWTNCSGVGSNHVLGFFRVVREEAAE